MGDLGLSVAGALLATLAGQFDGGPTLVVRHGGGSRACNGHFSDCADDGQAQSYVVDPRPFSAEALKREAYKCAARATPYDGDDTSRMTLLNEERERMEETVDDLLNKAVTPST